MVTIAYIHFYVSVRVFVQTLPDCIKWTCTSQLMVNCWFEARWFGILEVHPSNIHFYVSVSGYLFKPSPMYWIPTTCHFSTSLWPVDPWWFAGKIGDYVEKCYPIQFYSYHKKPRNNDPVMNHTRFHGMSYVRVLLPLLTCSHHLC